MPVVHDNPIVVVDVITHHTLVGSRVPFAW
jgi:hypothetical protein